MKSTPIKAAALALILAWFPTASLAGPLEDAAALAFLQQHAPAIHGKILSLRSSDPADYRSALDDAVKAAAEFEKITAAGDATTAAAYLKMYTIDYAAIELADEVILTQDTATQAALTKKLETLIGQSFEQWAIVEQARVRRLEAEVAAIKAELQNALADKTKVIRDDAGQLLEESRQHQAKKPH